MKGGPIILIGEPTDVLDSELASFFSTKGLKAVRTRTLKETLLALQSRRVDALVLDAALLEEDCGFLTIIKGIDEHVPIILCAEVNTPEFESRVRQQRIFFYHIKSFGMQDLEMAISNAVQKSLQHHSGGSRHGAAEQD